MSKSWKKPTRCDSNGCVEVAEVATGVELRSSRRPDTVLLVDADEWVEFVAAVKAGDFDEVAGAL